jgi:hypothetical protein
MSKDTLHRDIAEPGSVQKIAVPADARAHCTLSHIDYEDAFAVDLGGARDRTAEQWARTLLESAPAAVRATLMAGWTAIGLKLGGAPADQSLLGWEIRRGTPDVVLLHAGSRIGMPAELLLTRDGHSLLFCTFVQHDNHVARAVWAGTEPLHVPIVRHILADAVRRSNQRQLQTRPGREARQEA